MDKAFFERVLTVANQNKASDIHLAVGEPPYLRVNGELVPVKFRELASEDTYEIAKVIVGKNPMVNLDQLHEFDCSYELAGVARFRVNLFRERGAIGLVLRLVPQKIQGFTALHLPVVLEQISNLRRGLVLFTGATGNGKSTSVASLLHHINQARPGHILTVEDPIEFVLPKGKGVVTQRELGLDTRSFATALTAALRQDPDIIMIGEMRDVDTVDVALKAAETGHLVVSTVHTPDAVKTIQRLAGFFKGEDQAVARHRIAENLMAAISLRLVPAKGGGRIPAVEVLRVNRTAQEYVKNAERTGDLYGLMAASREFGMQTFDQALLDLVRGDKVTVPVAKSFATSPEEFERSVMLDG